MRVLQVLGRSAGGIARHVAQVTAALDGVGRFEVDIAGPQSLPVVLPKAVVPLQIPDGPFGHRDAVRRLRGYLRQGRYEVVHAHGLRAGIDAARAARREGVPALVTVHNLVQPEIAGGLKARLYRAAEPLAVRLADRTFAVSEEIARHLRRSLLARGARIEVLHLGVGDAPRVTCSREEVRAELGLTDESLVVTASRLSAQKAVHVMLEALARLDDTVVLAVLGEGELEGSLRDRARALGIAERVHFLGFRVDVADFVAAADVFCLSSIWEGVPLSVQEAILLGAPVVATRVGGMPEIVTDGVSGRLVPRDAPDALATALSEVLDDAETRRRYVARARADLVETFSTDRMLARLRSAYREAAGET